MGWCGVGIGIRNFRNLRICHGLQFFRVSKNPGMYKVSKVSKVSQFLNILRFSKQIQTFLVFLSETRNSRHFGHFGNSIIFRNFKTGSWNFSSF